MPDVPSGAAAEVSSDDAFVGDDVPPTCKPCVLEPLNPCAEALACDHATGLCTAEVPKSDGTPCSDPGSCEVWTCQSGACAMSGVVTCDAESAADPCHEYACYAGICSIESAVTGAACDDGDPCTAGDACQYGGYCQGELVVTDDDNVCTADSCAGGDVVNAPLSGGACGPGRACAAGACLPVPCTPDCLGAACGSDGCGGTCGECPDDEVCTPSRSCETCAGPSSCTPMTYVPAGMFSRGCDPADGKACAAWGPPQLVLLDAFAIDVVEVSWAAYEDCVAASACAPSSWSGGPFDGPVTGVGWGMAQAYCTWLGKRLPTEAEWEKAARGGCELFPDCAGGTPAHPWGGAAPSCELAWLAGCDVCPTSVGTKEAGASPYGVVNMAGNVSEWVADIYAPLDLSPEPLVNPMGPGNGGERVYKGGACEPGTSACACARGGADPEVGHGWIGFRCAVSTL